MDVVNVLTPEIRGKIKREVDFLPGAWVEFYDDITVGAIQKAQEGSADINNNLQLLISQIADWNFADASQVKLPIETSSLSLLPYKILKWLTDQTAGILQSQNSEDKKKESPAS